MDRFISNFHRSFLAAILVVTVFALLMPACATTPQSALVEQVAVQYATGKFIEAKPDAQRAGRAADVIKVAGVIKTLASGDTATVDELSVYVETVLADAGLSPSDRLLANTLVAAVVAELQARVQNGILSPDDRLKVATALDWVIQAAQGYAS